MSERDSLEVQVKVAVCILRDLKSVARRGQKEKGKVKPAEARGRAPRAPLLKNFRTAKIRFVKFDFEVQCEVQSESERLGE